MTDIKFIIVDLFCGAGGTTTGFELAVSSSPSTKVAKVVACVNHDPIAIKSHWKNHPEVEHFEEDITLLYGVVKHGIFMRSGKFLRLVRLVNLYRAFYPDAKVILWASLECTNFSKAKGGMPRDADSRTLADHLHPYIIAIDPDYIQIENVVEFMSWGPLDDKGKPISKKNGIDWLRWRDAVCRHGYRDEWKEMNSADYGALTSRNRLFGCFAKGNLPIVWPKPTHAKNPHKTSMIEPLRKWEPVKKALDFDDEGQSVFNRKKPLSTKTMQRLYMGCVKHIAGGKKAFLSRYYGGNAEFRNHSIDEPSGVIRTNNSHAVVKACFIQKYNSNKAETGGNDGSSIDSPAPVVACQPRMALAQAFITKAFSANSNKSVNAGSGVEQPCPTVTCQPRMALAQAHFISKYYSGKPEDKNISVEGPAGTIKTKDSQALVFISKYNGVNGGKHDNSHTVEGPVGALTTSDQNAKVTATFIQKYYSTGGQHNSIDEPAATLRTKDTLSKVSAFYLDKQFSGSENHQSVEQPAGSILPNDKHSLIEAEKWLMNTNFNNIGSSLEEPSPVITADRHHHYIINPSWGGNSGSIEEPCHVVIARQDKAPLYLITTDNGPVIIPIYDGDCEWTIKLKEFMVLYGIADIKMRMLKVLELLVIQGFPSDYILLGNQSDQKKFIGNAVHPYIPKHWIEAFDNRFEQLKMAA